MGFPSPRGIRTGSDVVIDDLEDTYHRVGTSAHPTEFRPDEKKPGMPGFLFHPFAYAGSSGACVMRTNSGETSKPSSNSRHIGMASDSWLTTSGGVTTAAMTKAPTMM